MTTGNNKMTLEQAEELFYQNNSPVVDCPDQMNAIIDRWIEENGIEIVD